MPSAYQKFVSMSYTDGNGGLIIDYSRTAPSPEAYEAFRMKAGTALQSMAELEAGAISNPDEGRMVGHYWLRDASICPDPSIAGQITENYKQIKHFASEVHSGKIKSPSGKPFQAFVLIGIGGSALGPQLVSDALGSGSDSMKAYFLDNTDPDGFDRVFSELEGLMDAVLFIVVSKSGGTAETRNGMLEAKRRVIASGNNFEKQALAVTQKGSTLDKMAEADGWLARFPMWDWVGGRTSLMSAVGLLPAALQGLDTDAFLEGARYCDSLGRYENWRQNPSLILAIAWMIATEGKSKRSLVVLPYKDRLALLSKYLQQLVMESLGKELDEKGNKVNQGITIFGNKGSTDQHSYVQQLVEGPDHYLVSFIEVLRDRMGLSMSVDGWATSGDYLTAFLTGTRQALSQKNRPSLTITVPEVNEYYLGAIIALFERSVGFYASMVGINAYHQPGVEAGKLSAGKALLCLKEALAFLASRRGESFNASEIADAIGMKDDAEAVFIMLRHASMNPEHGVAMDTFVPSEAKFWLK